MNGHKDAEKFNEIKAKGNYLEREYLLVESRTLGQLGMKCRSVDMLLLDTDRFAVQTRHDFNRLTDFIDSWCSNETQRKLLSIIHSFEAIELASPAISGDGSV